MSSIDSLGEPVAGRAAVAGAGDVDEVHVATAGGGDRAGEPGDTGGRGRVVDSDEDVQAGVVDLCGTGRAMSSAPVARRPQGCGWPSLEPPATSSPLRPGAGDERAGHVVGADELRRRADTTHGGERLRLLEGAQRAALVERCDATGQVRGGADRDEGQLRGRGRDGDRLAHGLLAARPAVDAADHAFERGLSAGRRGAVGKGRP